VIFSKLSKQNILFDSHTHICSDEFTELDSIIENAKSADVKYIFDTSVTFEYIEKSLEVSTKYKDFVYSFVGLDPEIFIPEGSYFIGFNIDNKFFEDSYSKLRSMISQNLDSIIGIGETGMDFFHFRDRESDVREKSRKLQERLFRMQLELAQEFSLPLTIHSRFAENECLKIVKEYDVRGVFHSYTGDYETAKKILDSGWGLGVNGIITFKNAEESRSVYKKILGQIPNDIDPEYFYSRNIYFETDAPYLSPEGRRGERNEPANIPLIFSNFCKMLQ
jgi:TatD DNase family protein